MQSPPAEENTEEGNDDGDGGWGISSVSAAFGGWGLTSSDPDQQQEDDEWKRQSRQMEDVAAHLPDQVAKAAEEAEHVLEDAVGEATAAASSWFSGASSYFSGEEAASAAEVDEGGEKEGDDNDNKPKPASSSADALTSILQYNPLNSLAVGWINDLERESNTDDPLRPIRDHLDAHLKDWPRSTYEEWVEESLVQLDKWDRGSAVVDETFYLEGSVHRRLWNDCMMADEMRCVLARKPRSAAATAATTTTTTTASAASSTKVSLATAGEEPTATDAKKKEETSSPSLQTKTEMTKKATTSSSSAVSAAKSLLNEDDADLDELLGGVDEDDEICFVSPPNSGGL